MGSLVVVLMKIPTANPRENGGISCVVIAQDTAT